MGKSIKISAKHGVNPSMDMCFWCGEAKGIVLFGKLKGDVEAPREVISGYKPCDKCISGMSLGITLIEVTEIDNGNPTLGGFHPTGRWVVVKDEAIPNMLNDPEIAEEVIKARRCLIPVVAFEGMGLGR